MVVCKLAPSGIQNMNIRERLHEIIFEAETPAGKAFDVILLLLIGVSVLVVTLESIPSVQQQYGDRRAHV